MSQTLFEKQASWRLQTKVTNGNFALVTIGNLFNKAPVAVVSWISVSWVSVSRAPISRTGKAADRHSLVFFCRCAQAVNGQ
ncbi:hypothetical protein [Shewanella algae]|uniref:hypothetical protein n=1 Tax=Shewanella algae TaxID=38313 RepID=UPI001AACBBDE|nr:hypothetical protein [Shewanella algae]MBO2567871.1 hypothetical protein [Shewanella algae]MBO2576472.1 hypothetical protein [Shewanella algae]MBO2580783.1 hypothetical protein [Shewanella algae]MBO2682016.1 hypothetical protein [Shewanella algae]